VAAVTAGGSTHRVTVVVMTRDRWPDLQGSLPRHEAPVVLVDNGSSDGTPELVRRHFPHVDVVELGTNHGSVARNIGVQRARTPYVAFADDDSWWAPGALEQAADLLDAHPRLAVLAGRVLVGADQQPDPICALTADSPLPRADDLPGPSVLGFLACGAVVRRDAYLAGGGFDDVIFFMGEEERLALDLTVLGWGLAYVDSVVAHHHPSPVRDSLDRQARAARNRLLTMILRRPWPVVLAAVVDDLRAGRAGRMAVRQTVSRLPRALRRRRRLPAEVEAARRLLDAPPVATP
jgi:GT2 family glycosyltransferase